MFMDEEDFAKIVESLDIDASPLEAHRDGLRKRMVAALARQHGGMARDDGVVSRPDARPAERESTEGAFRRLVDGLDIDATPRPGHREQLAREMFAAIDHKEPSHAIRSSRTSPVTFIRAFLRKMPKPTVAVAVALAVLIGVGIGVFPTRVAQATPSFGTVLEHVRQARAVVYDLVFQTGRSGPRHKIRVMVNEAGRVRWELPNGKVHIRDLHQNVTLMLQPAQKEALEFRLKMSPTRAKFDPVEVLRQLPAKTGKFVGVEKVDGQDVDLFVAEEDRQTVRVWADSTTNLPVHIEVVDRTAARVSQMKMIMTNFAWTADMPASLFSLEPPEGYVLRRIGTGATEADLVDSLRYCAKVSGGTFPADFTKQGVAVVLLTAMRKGGEVKMTAEIGQSSIVFVDVEEGQKAILTVCMEGAGFAEKQRTAGNDWNYRGGGIKIGDKQSPICWWRPKGSAAYRVVYGDLSIREIEPGQLGPRRASP